MKLLSFVITLLFLLLNVPASDAAGTVKIAAILSKTGKAALDNKNTLNGIRLAVEELNEKGGLLGKEIELLELDNSSSALGSKLAADKAVKSNVIAVIGANYSSHSQAMAPVLQQAKIPMISPYATSPQVSLVGNYIFRICYIDPFQGRVMANFSFHDLGARKAIVLINANMTYCEGLANYFSYNFKKLGGVILAEENYLDKTADFSFLIEKIKNLEPDIIFLPGHLKDSGFIIKQARAAGISTTFAGGDGWNDTMYKSVGSVIRGSYYSNHWHPDVSSKESKAFVEKYKKRSEEFDMGNALGHDCVFLLADAVKRAGILNTERIRDAIAATENFRGITGNIKFDRNGDPIKSAVILKFGETASVFVKQVEP